MLDRISRLNAQNYVRKGPQRLVIARYYLPAQRLLRPEFPAEQTSRQADIVVEPRWKQKNVALVSCSIQRTREREREKGEKTREEKKKNLISL